MALSASLHLRQSQSLVMTPQLMQSIQLLQMTHLELGQFIAQEVEKNPLLEFQTGEETDLSQDRAGRDEAAPLAADTSGGADEPAGQSDLYESAMSRSGERLSDELDANFAESHGYSGDSKLTLTCDMAPRLYTSSG